MLVLVEDAAESLTSSDFEVGDLLWVSDGHRQWVRGAWVVDALSGRWEL